MYKGKNVAVVIPAYNEERLIDKVMEAIPNYVDSVVVIDDCSKDRTAQIVAEYQGKDTRVVLISHEKNQGVGGSIASGYKWAKDNQIDITVVMAGDNQMDPNDLPLMLDPVASQDIDFSKGNRLFTGQAYKVIPKLRYFGNALLSLFTKFASGYWHVADSQSGYTAIGKKALDAIDWDKMYKRYGQPNDLLVMLNIYDFKVRDVPINPVYNVGERSGIRLRKVVFSISWLLVRRFFWRLKEKYIIRDFHPLVFFYMSGLALCACSIFLFARVIHVWVFIGSIPKVNFLAWMFSAIMGVQFVLFAMWFDMERNKNLR